ncbi:MAG: biopolymer transporter ExbD [candidate division KSB1 bacterium]|nr:biopolymer transporter ExbD [candidate division KSB1 bacterium]MDZ7305153.1 biopolymer transporter ExbD [candidate division KSB1 bacterium]MDZ7314237.1 biopolymer transporter ExbD [candidate division KSB1 bacterium]
MSAGMIVRMIDIVMILLFGFICTAELSTQSKITLPATVELPAVNPDPEMVVFVGILRDGTYLLENETSGTQSLDKLEQYLLAKRNELAKSRYKMRVRLRANHDTPIRFVMKAADICDRINSDTIPVLKTVDVRISSKYTR